MVPPALASSAPGLDGWEALDDCLGLLNLVEGGRHVDGIAGLTGR